MPKGTTTVIMIKSYQLQVRQALAKISVPGGVIKDIIEALIASEHALSRKQRRRLARLLLIFAKSLDTDQDLALAKEYYEIYLSQPLVQLRRASKSQSHASASAPRLGRKRKKAMLRLDVALKIVFLVTQVFSLIAATIFFDSRSSYPFL